jgi:N-acyl-L-homoserine lactone synthetase
MSVDRESAHHLLDQLAPAQLAAVIHLMETMVPRMLRNDASLLAMDTLARRIPEGRIHPDKKKV